MDQEFYEEFCNIPSSTLLSNLSELTLQDDTANYLDLELSLSQEDLTFEDDYFLCPEIKANCSHPDHISTGTHSLVPEFQNYTELTPLDSNYSSFNTNDLDIFESSDFTKKTNQGSLPSMDYLTRDYEDLSYNNEYDKPYNHFKQDVYSSTNCVTNDNYNSNSWNCIDISDSNLLNDLPHYPANLETDYYNYQPDLDNAVSHSPLQESEDVLNRENITVITKPRRSRVRVPEISFDENYENNLGSYEEGIADWLQEIKESKNARPRGPKCWEFLIRLLGDPRSNPSLIRWEDQQEGVFRLVNKDKISSIWGSRPCKKKKELGIKYDSFARNLRYHYKRGNVISVSEKHLVYRFPKEVLNKPIQ